MQLYCVRVHNALRREPGISSVLEVYDSESTAEEAIISHTDEITAELRSVEAPVFHEEFYGDDGKTTALTNGRGGVYAAWARLWTWEGDYAEV